MQIIFQLPKTKYDQIFRQKRPVSKRDVKDTDHNIY